MARKPRRRPSSRRTEGTQSFVRRVLRGFIEEVRVILKRCAPDYYRRFPGARHPCHTCAFNPATDSWRGAYATAYHLMQALENDQPFYCHENLPYLRGWGWVFDRKKARLCAGWAVVQGDPKAKTAFLRAALRAGPPQRLGELQGDFLREAR